MGEKLAIVELGKLEQAMRILIMNRTRFIVVLDSHSGEGLVVMRNALTYEIYQ